MRNFLLLLFRVVFFLPVVAVGQTRVYNTVKISSKAPVIDGYIDEDVWKSVEWQGDFTQQEPYEFAPPSQQTAFKVLYDDNNLYVAVRAYDSEPEKIERRLGRRDHFDGDWIAVGLSSHFDSLTGYGFSVNSVGVKGDGRVSNDTDWDDTWDPVYYVKTSIDDEGWVAEFKIPFNQLRFGKKEKYIWGLEVMRQLFRKEEMSLWQMVPKDASGWVSKWGQLHGIKNIKPKKEIAIAPYITGGIEKNPVEEDNPFEHGYNGLYNAGIDGKIAITNDLTLNFTVNPDFGQVESDPSKVNLSAFESYFDDKRPFFIEGSNIYKYPLIAGQSWSRENLFYSRRIGRYPQREIDLYDNEYIDNPQFTRILGAFKLSGKTQNGWSIGVLESLTNNEFATVDSAGVRSKEIVEPMTNYFNARIQKDLVKGKTIIGGIFTATNRFINDTVLNFLPEAAYTGGFDFDHYWGDRTFNIKMKVLGSSISGTEESIIERQMAPQRYYQRPDATHLNVDSTLTQLSGISGSASLSKIGGGHWRYGLMGSFVNPGFSINDMGYLRRADVINETGWVEYIIWKPFSIFRKMSGRVNQWLGWDFNGRWIYSGMRARFSTQFKNYWTSEVVLSLDGFDIDRHQLRGGPSVRTPGATELEFEFGSDRRKKLIGGAFVSRKWGADDWKNDLDMGFNISYRPISNLLLSVDPLFVHDKWSLAYVETTEYKGEPVFIVGSLNRKSIQLNFRIDYSITPEISVQYWGQPYFFSADYIGFKKVVDAGNRNYYDQFHIFDDSEIMLEEQDNNYIVDESGDGQTDYSFANPDFSFFEFRSNFVIRWEYIPGSTAYFVWSQGRNGSVSDGSFYLKDRIQGLMEEKPGNIFLLKLSYRLSF